MSTQHETYRADEFMQFMEQLWLRHPEIVKDQHVGWAKYWAPRVDLGELQRAREDSVPIDDHLGTMTR